MKYTAGIVIGILVFIGIVLSTCEKRKTDIYAVVNGVNIHGQDFLTEENRKSDELKKAALEAFIEKTVIRLEAEKLQTTETELFSFFDSLKTRNISDNQVAKLFKDEFKDQNITPKSKAEMLQLVRDKQYDLARKKYIYELKTRSTILTVDDDGVFHTYKPHLD